MHTTTTSRPDAPIATRSSPVRLTRQRRLRAPDRPAPRRVSGGPTRRGITTIWGIASIGLLLTFAALVVDGAMLYTSHADLQIAADSGALAGASALTTDPDLARQRAIEYAAKNFANGESFTLTEDNIQLGDWNAEDRTFTPLSGEDEAFADAVRVTAGMTEAGGNPLSMAFAQVFGVAESDVVAEAIAVYRPRDIVLVLDLSGSMNFDSQVRHIPYLGEEAIEDNLYQIWQELGGETWGNMAFEPVYISTYDDWWVLNYLGLHNEPYPYPVGSWHDYVNYVQGSSRLSQNGYNRKYGVLTFMNYLLEKRRHHTHTPDLWRVSAQPITAVKDSVDIFLDFIEDVATEDRVGLAVYTASDSTALLEHELTDEIDAVRTISRRRQAGHYHGSTNIGAGLREGRLELDRNGRDGTLKTIVLLTDGQANLPGNSSAARAYALEQAQHAADAGYAIAAISLGAKVDASLMANIAEISGGVHFHVPGGQSVDSYEAELIEVFRHIARERPLRLVH
jgi:Mg-chelatase subunit ChlD